MQAKARTKLVSLFSMSHKVHFDSFMTQFFDKVYDPVWMNKKSKNLEGENVPSSMNKLLSEKLIKDGTEEL